MKEEELLALPVTVSVECAGRALNLGRSKANDLARAGQFPVPVLPLGNRRVVTKVALLTYLGYEYGEGGWHPARHANPDAA